MIVYWDLMIALNGILDVFLLLAVSLILKRYASWIRIVLGGLIGGVSVLFLCFLSGDVFSFFLKLLVSIVMVIVTFSYKNVKYFFHNLFYLYLVSILLGGSLYLFNIEFHYQNQGLLVVDKGISISFSFLLVIAILVLFFYVLYLKNVEKTANYYYSVEVFIKHKKYSFIGFLDTGNHLRDPYKKRPVILAYTTKIPFCYEDGILVPYETASGSSILKCVLATKIVLNGEKTIPDVLVGVVTDKLSIEGADMLLHSDFIGG